MFLINRQTSLTVNRTPEVQLLFSSVLSPEYLKKAKDFQERHMLRKGLHYVNPRLGRQISELVDQFSDGSLKLKPEEFPFRLKKILPIDKMNRETVHR